MNIFKLILIMFKVHVQFNWSLVTEIDLDYKYVVVLIFFLY